MRQDYGEQFAIQSSEMKPKTKHIVTAVIFLALVGFSGWALYFYQKNFSGVYPAISRPSNDIAALIRNEKFPLVYPDMFALSIFAEGLTDPRVITFDSRGTMLVSLTSAGRVVALPDTDKNGRADRVVEVISRLNRPHGLAFSPGRPDRLYIAEKDRVTAYTYNQEQFTINAPEHIVDLPDGGGHSTRTLLFLPPPSDDKLLISVGSSCNSCEETDWRRAKILVTDSEGNDLKTYASGLRNAVFMTSHPETREIWATEMGRDYLGDNLPPDEINIIRPGKDYGWPSCYGRNVPDVEYLDSNITAPCNGKTPSFIDIQAHSAPLGLDFFPGKGWPEQYRNCLLVAYHGSWNRSEPTGYKLVLFRFSDRGELLDREDFVSGWLTGANRSIGRPVDIKIRDDGIIFISDDKAGVIYRMALKPGDASF
jgi:glucose/arabinose dehydrogenase